MSTCICFLFFILRTCHTLYHIHLCHSLQAADPPGWLYLRNTQTPSALISFFCCATPHKQEKNQEKKITKTIKAQTFTLFSVQQKQYFLNTWKRAKLTLMKKHPLKKKKKKILNQFYSTFTEKFCCLLRFIVHLGFFRVWFLGFVFRF